MRAAKLDVAQVYGDQALAGVRVWKAFRCVGRAIPPAAGVPAGSEAVLLDGLANGQSFDWTGARCAADKVIIAGGLDATNVARAVCMAQPWGVDASSRLESSPGVKDHEKMKRFIEAALKA
jgi:phosphoribosylanthranilate isomerase